MERHLGRGWVPALASLTRITCEILLCTHLTLPTVWHLLTTSSSATLLISYSSRLTTPPPRLFLFSLLPRLCFLSHTCNPSLAVSSQLRTLTLHPPPIYFFTLCCCSPREAEVCKLFSPWCIPSLLLVHLKLQTRKCKLFLKQRF